MVIFSGQDEIPKINIFFTLNPKKNHLEQSLSNTFPELPQLLLLSRGSCYSPIAHCIKKDLMNFKYLEIVKTPKYFEKI